MVREHLKGLTDYTVAMKDYGVNSGEDRHANQRDKKRNRRMRQRLMRGNRSVFEIQKAIVKRGREAKGER